MSGTVYVCESCGASADVVTTQLTRCACEVPGGILGLKWFVIPGPITALCRACHERQKADSDDD